MISRRSFIPLALFFVALAAAIRLPDLGFKPLMHDESLFGYFSYYLWTRGALDYDPILHGPLLMQVNAIVFAILGATDTTLRLYCALCGIGVVALIVWLRPLRDDVGNLAAAFLAAVSPALCYYSRFCRNDIDFVFFTMLWVAACAKYWRTKRARWGVAAILAFTALACDKENIVFLIAAAAGFWALMIAVDLMAGQLQAKTIQGQGGQKQDDTRTECPKISTFKLWLFFNNVSLIILFVAYLFCRHAETIAALRPLAIFAFIVLGAPFLSIPAAILYAATRAGAGAERLQQRIVRRLWRDRYFLGSAAIAGLIFFLLSYNYFQIGRFNPVGVAQQVVRWGASGSHGSVQWLKPPQSANIAGTLGFFDIIGRAVSYWWGQHAEHRLRGPFHYYVTIMVIYEWPALLIALAGGVCGLLASRMRLIASVIALTAAIILAWLTGAALAPARLDDYLHIQSHLQLALTLAFSALFLTLTVAELLRRRRARAFLIFWMGASLLAYSYAGEKVPWLVIHIVLPLVLLAGDYFASFARAACVWIKSERLRVQWMGSLAATMTVCLMIAGGLKWSLDTGRLLGNAHDPAERMVYNHTTPETKVYAAEILQTRERRYAEGKTFHVSMTGEAGWPLLWYLREIEGNDMDLHDDLTKPTADVIICDPADLERYPRVKQQYEQWLVPLRDAWVPPVVSLGRRLMAGADPAVWPVYEPAQPESEWRWLKRYWWARERFPPPMDAGGVSPILSDKFIYAVRIPLREIPVSGN
ncbi:MAG: TIGR03663 family protein [Candidatus Sumerlaeota bacterium]|nr:TIGR03663 family protein [Candidatus Sumerlaeota bacterium]